MRSRSSFAQSIRSRLPVLTAISLLTVACQATVEISTSTPATTEGPLTTTTPSAPTTTTVRETATEAIQEPEPTRGVGRFVRLATLGDIHSDNTLCGDPILWGAASPVADTRPSLYTVAMPGLNVVPDLAQGAEPPAPRLEGSEWVVEVSLRTDAVWSDGEAITASDVIFAFDLAEEPWGECLHLEWRAGVSGIRAIDDHKVWITFDAKPGLGVWPHGIGMASIKAEHFWAPHVETALQQGQAAVEAIADPATAIWEALADPSSTPEDVTRDQIDEYLEDVYNAAVGGYLQTVSGIGEPSGGSMVFSQWNPNQSVRYMANPLYYRSGEEIQSGVVTYTIGPFVDGYENVIFGSQYEAVLALMEGEVDYQSLNPMPAISTVLGTNPDVARVTNPFNAFWYVGLNLRKPPMSDLAFRRAVAVMIDRDFLADEVFQGGMPPTWTLLPESNLQFFDPETAARIAAKYRDMDRFERLETAVGILEEAGYTWEQKPTVGTDERGEPSIEPGSGIRMPDGNQAPELEVLDYHPGSGYIWFTSYGHYIQRWLQDLGFRSRSQTSTGGYVVERVWPGVGVKPTFDLVLLGWNLGSPAFPTFHEAFLHSRHLAEVNDGNNAVGYVNPEFDQLADQIYQVETVEDARQIIWQLEAIIDRDLPYIVLVNTVSVEAYRTSLEFPFTDTIGGLMFNGDLLHALELVRIRE